MDDAREIVARAMCRRGGFDPDEIMPNDGPRWRYYLDGADAAIAAYHPIAMEMAAGVAEAERKEWVARGFGGDCARQACDAIAAAIRAITPPQGAAMEQQP